MQKPILKLLPEPVNGVIGKFLMDNTEYFKGIEENLRKYGTSSHFDGGYFNGYVVVLPEHPFYGKDYDEVSNLLSKKGFYVHGGLTFANDDKDFCPELSKHFSDYWILGFDTRHANDTAAYWTEERTWEEADKLMQAIINYGK
jgi:hypothetical protein